METEEMKSLWASQSGKEMQKNALAGMLSEKSHPVLRKIKRQLLIEIIMWLVILCGYYSAFDGDRRPVPANFVISIGIASSRCCKCFRLFDCEEPHL